MWDAMYCAIAETLVQHKEADFTRKKDEIARRVQTSITHGFFADDNNITSVKRFIARKDELRDIFRRSIEPRDAIRSFPPQLKEELFMAQGGDCGLCQQSIDESRLDEADYVHIDHKKPHASGGPTTRDNAQLVHAACNRSKGAKEIY